MTVRHGFRIIALVVLGCALIGFAEALQLYWGYGAAGRPLGFVRAMKATMPSWFVLAAAAPAIFWLARRFPLFDGGRRAHWLVHLVAAVVYSVTYLIVVSWISDYLLHVAATPVPFLDNLRRLLATYGVLNVFFYAALVGGYQAWRFHRRLREEERAAADLALRALRLETGLANAKLEALRLQLNPHFLFNTLNTVSVLAMKGDGGGVVRIVGRLGDLLRLTLDQSRRMVALEDELEFLDGYLEIERARFRDRLRVVRDIEPAALDAEVPSLLLQPLVENAVRHGIGRSSEGGEVRITGRVRDGRLELEVHDDGPGFRSAGEPESGIGLRNTRDRLRELYGEDCSFHCGNCDRGAGGATVRISLPYRRFATDLAAHNDAHA